MLPWGVPALALLLTAIIPYPRYVTDECVVRSLQRVDVRAQTEGVITEIRVDEGDFVHEGDVLAQLDARDVDAAWNKAKAEVQRLAANVEKMHNGFRKEEVARARAALAERAVDVKFATAEARRQQVLFDSSYVSAATLDDAKRPLELAKRSWAQARAELDLMESGFRPEDVSLVEAELKRAQIEVAYLETKRGLLTIRAPIDGQVVTPKFREHMHEKVPAGGKVCELADTRKMRAETFVAERETDILALGQRVKVKVEGLPLHPFYGTVSFISPAVQERDGRRVVRVDALVDNPERLLRERMSGYGEVNTGNRPLLVLALRRLVRWTRVRFLI